MVLYDASFLQNGAIVFTFELFSLFYRYCVIISEHVLLFREINCVFLYYN